MKSVVEAIAFCDKKMASPDTPKEEKLIYLDLACYLREYRALHEMLKRLAFGLPELEGARS